MAKLSADTAPAAMPGVYRLADEFERELFAWRNLPSRDGAALRACAYAIAQKAEALFAPILAEKEREKDAALFASRHETDLCQQALDDRSALEARALAAEAALATATGLLVRAKDHIVHNADDLSMHSPAVKLVEGIASAIRAQGEA